MTSRWKVDTREVWDQEKWAQYRIKNQKTKAYEIKESDKDCDFFHDAIIGSGFDWGGGWSVTLHYGHKCALYAYLITLCLVLVLPYLLRGLLSDWVSMKNQSLIRKITCICLISHEPVHPVSPSLARLSQKRESRCPQQRRCLHWSSSLKNSSWCLSTA